MTKRRRLCGDFGHKTSAGNPCKNPAIRGGTVCAQRHGGSAPQVKRKAQERLADLIDPDRVLRELAKVAYSDFGELLDGDGNLKPAKDWPAGITARIKKVEIVKRNLVVGDGLLDDVHKVEFWDKMKAVELLCKHLGLLTEKVEHSGGIRVSWESGDDGERTE